MPESTLREPVTVVQESLIETRPVAAPEASNTLTFGFWPRAGIVAALTAFACSHVIVGVVSDAIAGSRTAYLLVLPVLVALIVHGRRGAVRGVTDTETDWIAVLLAGIAGFTGLHLLSERMPTTAAAWGLPAVNALLWFACSMAVLFGIRHVVRLWPLWLFTLALATPLPYLLTVAVFGGSDVAAAAVAGAAGAAAVWLSTRAATWRWRLLATLGSAGAATAYLAAWGGRAPLIVDVLMVGGLVPVLAYAVHVVLIRRTGADAGATAYPRRSPASLVALTVAAAALFALQPSTPSESALPTVDAGWAGRAGLGEPTSFDFVTRYLGADASLRRYAAARTGDQPAGVVDVLSSPDRKALEDYADTIWYPTRRPVQYQPIELSGPTALNARAAHTDAGAATTSTAEDWYALSWLWHAGDEYQQVTVLVNQRPDANQLPPAPTPPSLGNSVVAPALWIARQQVGGSGAVAPLVTQRARDLVSSLVASAGDHPAGNPIGV